MNEADFRRVSRQRSFDPNQASCERCRRSEQKLSPVQIAHDLFSSQNDQNPWAGLLWITGYTEKSQVKEKTLAKP
jgi:hypothetical protein